MEQKAVDAVDAEPVAGESRQRVGERLRVLIGLAIAIGTREGVLGRANGAVGGAEDSPNGKEAGSGPAGGDPCP